LSSVDGYTSEVSVTWPLWCQTFDYLSSLGASPPIDSSLTGTPGCEQLAQSRYTAAPRPGVEHTTCWLDVQHSTRCTTMQSTWLLKIVSFTVAFQYSLLPSARAYGQWTVLQQNPPNS